MGLKLDCLFCLRLIICTGALPFSQHYTILHSANKSVISRSVRAKLFKAALVCYSNRYNV